MSKQTQVLPDNKEIIQVQQELLEKANEALRAKIDWVIDWYKRDTRHSLTSRWQLGTQIGEILQDQGRGRAKTYGTRAFQTIAAFCGEAAGSLRICARLAHCYTEREITDIGDKVMADGVTTISFSHMRVLLALPSEEQRSKAIELILAHCWTVEQLGQYVKEQLGNQGVTSHNRGRPVAVPRDLDGVIRQQLSFAEDFDKRNVRVWNDPTHSLTGHLANMPAVQYTEELATQLGVLAHKMRQLATEAAARAQEAEDRYNEVLRVLDTDKPKLASQVTTDDFDEDDEEAREERIRSDQQPVLT